MIIELIQVLNGLGLRQTDIVGVVMGLQQPVDDIIYAYEMSPRREEYHVQLTARTQDGESRTMVENPESRSRIPG